MSLCCLLLLVHWAAPLARICWTSLRINLLLMQQGENEQHSYGASWILNTATHPLFVSSQSSSRSRPGLLKAGDPGLPWLADSWPSTSLPANGGLGSPKGGNNFGRGGKKYKQAGVNTVLAMPGWTVLMLIPWEAQWQGITHKHAHTNKHTRSPKLKEPLSSILC